MRRLCLSCVMVVMTASAYAQEAAVYSGMPDKNEIPPRQRISVPN